MTNNLHITLTAKDIHEEALSGKTIVVIDILRATSVIVTALSNGARWVKTAATIEEAFELKSIDVLLGGERNALPVDGFDLGNSPLEYTAERIRNKGIVLTTTNGTLALSKCRLAKEVIIGSFLNHRSVIAYLGGLDGPVELICAGTNGEFSLDDFLCAGLICTTLSESGPVELDDLCRLAVQTWKEARKDIHSALSDTTHYIVLKSKGFQKDLEYCLTVDSMDILVRQDNDLFVAGY